MRQLVSIIVLAFTMCSLAMGQSNRNSKGNGKVEHVNDGVEVLVVIDGEIDMHYREDGEEKVAHMKLGEMFVAAEGDEHFARPIGEARVLVIEREGSV